jgi:hypothetical protein
LSRGHRPGHHEPTQETIGLLALEIAQSLGCLAHGFGDNGTAVIAVGTNPTPLASVTVTPQRSGKFQVTATAIATSGDFAIAIGHDSTVDYSQSVGASLINAITMAYGSRQVPTIFPVSIPVTIVLFGQASVSGQVFIRPHQAQLTVLELPN